jgi:hypothetical protein
MIMPIPRLSLWTLLLFMVSTTAMALPARVFVSPTGMDVGACPITAPCRSFNYAMTQVAPAGEIIALDTAGYGVVTISQAVTIVAAPGATAFIAVTGGATGISVIAGNTDVVNLRGLALSSSGGAIGIDFHTGLSLNVENTVVNGFTSIGIDVDHLLDGISSHAQVSHCTIRNNAIGIGAGISAGSPNRASRVSGFAVAFPQIVSVTVSESDINDNSISGILASDSSRFAVADTVLAGNGTGVQAGASGFTGVASQISLDRCTISRNGTGIAAGVNNVGGTLNGLVRVANCMIVSNFTGVSALLDGSILSRTTIGSFTNTLEGNTINGAFGGTYTAQ